jgi:general secretion pathway protein B
VYSSTTSERFAFINSRKYTEGQSLTEGPLLEKITQDGVLLSYRGKRFILPRQ